MEQIEEQKVVEQPMNKWLLYCARLVSVIFTPFLVPLIAFCLLFFCTYLRIIPFQARIQVLSLVVCFTIAIPLLAIYVLQWLKGWSFKDLGKQEHRPLLYILTILSYVTCLIAMYHLRLPRYMTGIIMASLLCMVMCILINCKWKISVHVASGGLMVGGLISYGVMFNFNPVFWLGWFILLTGILGTARMILCRHTLLEVFIGFLVGLFCGVIGILFI